MIAEQTRQQQFSNLPKKKDMIKQSFCQKICQKKYDRVKIYQTDRQFILYFREKDIDIIKFNQ